MNDVDENIRLIGTFCDDFEEPKITMIDSGTYGSVYEVSDLNRKVAVKVVDIPGDDHYERLLTLGKPIDSVQSDIDDSLNKAVAEAELMAHLKEKSSHIVYVEKYKSVPVELSSGLKVYKLLIRMERLKPYLATCDTGWMIEIGHSEEKVIKLGIDICNALCDLKDSDIIHRDIKPSNILRDNSHKGNYKLGDFGTAQKNKASWKTLRAGTDTFMAPEQYHSSNYDKRVDYYSLGLVLYCLMNENDWLPFQIGDRDSGFERRINPIAEAFPKPTYASEAFWKVIKKACSYYPDDRYQSAEEFLKALEQIKDVKPEEQNTKKEDSQNNDVIISEKIEVTNFEDLNVSDKESDVPDKIRKISDHLIILNELLERIGESSDHNNFERDNITKIYMHSTENISRFHSVEFYSFYDNGKKIVTKIVIDITNDVRIVFGKEHEKDRPGSDEIKVILSYWLAVVFNISKDEADTLAGRIMDEKKVRTGHFLLGYNDVISLWRKKIPGYQSGRRKVEMTIEDMLFLPDSEESYSEFIKKHDPSEG